jgi:hypothetical protein
MGFALLLYPRNVGAQSYRYAGCYYIEGGLYRSRPLSRPLCSWTTSLLHPMLEPRTGKMDRPLGTDARCRCKSASKPCGRISNRLALLALCSSSRVSMYSRLAPNTVNHTRHQNHRIAPQQRAFSSSPDPPSTSRRYAIPRGHHPDWRMLRFSRRGPRAKAPTRCQNPRAIQPARMESG